MNYTAFVGLDVAETMGIALYFPYSDEAHVFEYTGDPIEQLRYLTSILELITEPLICMELMHHFRNAITTRSLMGRYGYLKWSLKEIGYSISEISHQVSRSYLNATTKKMTHDLLKQGNSKITENHTDALAPAMYGAFLHLNKSLVLPKIEVKS
jgi:hypothetical protein